MKTKQNAPATVELPTVELPIVEKTLAEKRSEGVARSWKDPAVRTKRLARHAVRANGQDFASLYQAFRALRLPISKHIPFRGKLKAAGRATFDGVEFELVEIKV